MNQIKEFWNKINSKVDILLYLIILGIILACVGIYFVSNAIFFKQDVLQKYNIQNIKSFVVKASITLKEQEDVFEIEEEEVDVELPDKYQTLLESKLMIPDFKRNIINVGVEEPVDSQDTGEKKRELPSITGISFYGSVVSEDGKATALIYLQDKNYNAIVMEGEYAPNTDIKVEKINRFSVVLSKPGFKNTRLWLPKEIYLKNLSTWLDNSGEDNFIEKYPDENINNNQHDMNEEDIINEEFNDKDLGQ